MSLLRPLDCVTAILVREYADGSFSIEGSVGDKAYAIRVLQHAIDAIRRQPRPEDKPPGDGLLIKASDTDVKHHANYPVLPLGDRG